MNPDEHDSARRWEQRLRELRPASAEPLAHRVFFAAGQRSCADHARVQGTPSQWYRHWERMAWAAVVSLAVVWGHWSGRHQHQLAHTNPIVDPSGIHSPPAAEEAMADQLASSASVAATPDQSTSALASPQTPLIPAWLGLPASKLASSSHAVDRWPQPQGVEGALALTVPPPTRGQLLQELAPTAPASDSQITAWLGWLQTN